MRTIVVAFLSLFAFTASAGTITSLSPASFKVNSVEQFLTIHGTSLGDHVIFDGPAGHFELTANAVFYGSVVAWVPERILTTVGTYSVKVRSGGVDSNIVTFKVTGFKYFPLVLIFPEHLVVQPRTREGAWVKYEVVAFGGEDPYPEVHCDPPSGSQFAMGVSHVKCYATNSAGEKASGGFDISVLDREPPVLTVPDPISVRAESNEGTIVDYKVSAFDEIYGEAPVECTRPSGSVFPVGRTNVVCWAADFDLNHGYGAFDVDVIGEGKPYRLEVHVPDDVFIEAKRPEGAEFFYEVKVSGTDDREPRVTCEPRSGSLFPIGATTVICSALDAYGARGEASFGVTVYDGAPPQILRLAASPDILTPVEGQLVPVRIDVEAVDELDAAPFCAVSDVTANEPIDLGDFDNPKSYDWRITGPLSLELRAERTRVKERVYSVRVGCSDFYGNTAWAVAYVKVPYESSAGAVLDPAPKRRAVGRR